MSAKYKGDLYRRQISKNDVIVRRNPVTDYKGLLNKKIYEYFFTQLKLNEQKIQISLFPK